MRASCPALPRASATVPAALLPLEPSWSRLGTPALRSKQGHRSLVSPTEIAVGEGTRSCAAAHSGASPLSDEH